LISTKDLTVITPLVGYENTDPIWMFMTTCRRFGITPTFYGQGETYAGWVDIMLTKLLQAAKDCPTSHMLYTDSRDAYFLTGMDEIVEKYNAMGAPQLLMGADCVGFSSYQAYYDRVPWDMTKAFPFFQVGGMVCEAKALLEAIEYMFQQSAAGVWRDMPGDNPPWWCNFMVERPGELQIDHGCEIFQNCSNCMEKLPVVVCCQPTVNPLSRSVIETTTRVLNELTDSQPCILHFNGGYTAQDTGKWYAMEKTWRALGYTENPPWQK
jgi:hypothetical protein